MYTKANIYTTNQKVFFIKKTINRDNTPKNNLLSPNYIKNNNNFYYQTRTTKIKKHYIKDKSSDYPKENVIAYNSLYINKRLSKSSDKKREQERYNIHTKNNIYNRKINTNSKKKVKLKLSKEHRFPSKDLIFMTDKKDNMNNNIELIKKKKELEEQREIERKIMEWFYVNNINISKRDLFDTLTTLIQSAFRGWLFRKKINIVFRKNQKNNLSKKNRDIKNAFINLNKLYHKLMRKNLKFVFNKIKNCNEDKASYKKIEELIKQNNELQKKLGSVINENNNLRKETEICKEYKNKYQETLEQFNKIYKVNDNIIKENQILKNKLIIAETKKSPDENEVNKYSKYNYFRIDKLEPINYLKNENIDKKNKNGRCGWEFLKIEKQNHFKISFLNKPKKLEIENINQFNINSLNSTLSNVELIMKKENDINIISHVDNNNNEMKKKENEQELINMLKNEINLLKNQINENNMSKTELDKQLKLNKLKSLFNFKELFIRKNIHKYFLSFYYKSLSNKVNQENQENIAPNVVSQIPIGTPPTSSIPLGNTPQNLVNNDTSPISPIIQEQISNNNNNDINNINDTNKKEVAFSEQKEKEEKEKKSRLKKARNLRRLLSKKVQDKKDNIRKYFYKYEHIVMMFKIRSKLLEMKKKEIEKAIKEEKIENEKYRHIQSQRDRQERIASIFNKMDKKISLIKKTALEAWNVKTKVMSIKTILIPLKNKTKTKKKKKKPKSE